MSDTRIGVVGCGGRMGRMLLQVISAREGCAVAGGTEQAGNDLIGQDLGALMGGASLGVKVVDDPEALFSAADVVIDFTAPAATVTHAGIASESGTALVIGTTGIEENQQELIQEAAKGAAIVQAANMSLGVNLLLSLVEQVSASLSPDYDIEIVEMHHRHKVDAPSGTALALGKAAAAGRGVDLNEVAQRVRDGITGARRRGDIGFATLRGGDVVGDHGVVFAAEGERIELTHRASSRDVFAQGAVTAAQWVKGEGPGYYTMKDVLGLS